MRDVMPRDPAATDTGAVPRRGRQDRERAVVAARAVGLGAMLLALAGCAGARVSDIASAKAAGQPPAEILVEVSTPATAGKDTAETAEKVAAALSSDLIRRLTDSRITARPFVPGTSPPGDAVLHVTITEADPGSYLERFIVGFGFGRAELQAKADLESADAPGAYSMTAFNTSSASGRVMPGLVLPAGIALATRNIIPLAIGGSLKVATSFRGGLDNSADGTAEAVVGQIKKYYAASGWRWPADAKA